MKRPESTDGPVTPLPIVDSFLETIALTIKAAPMALLVLIPFELPWVLCSELVVPRIGDPRAEPALGAVYQIAWGILGSAALVVLVDRQRTHPSTSVGALVKTAILSPLRHWARTCASLFIASIVTGLLFLLGVVPGVVFWLSYAVVLPAVALEPEAKTYPLDRSRLLMRGHRLRALWFLLPFVLLETGMGLLLLVPGIDAGGPHVEWIVYGAGLVARVFSSVSAYVLWLHVTADRAKRDGAPRPTAF
ncbi:MAG: hypothetical protein IT379_26780 [Deltaproteobacteria bacterium]|nr:hypothetical protein [Deltaproteobacteria bacterium]